MIDKIKRKQSVEMNQVGKLMIKSSFSLRLIFHQISYSLNIEIHPIITVITASLTICLINVVIALLNRSNFFSKTVNYYYTYTVDFVILIRLSVCLFIRYAVCLCMNAIFLQKNFSNVEFLRAIV